MEKSRETDNKTQEKEKQNKKHNTICVGQHYTQDTKNVRFIWWKMWLGFLDSTVVFFIHILYF